MSWREDLDVLEIRSFRDTDAAAVWRLHNIALAATGAHAGPGPWDDDLHQVRSAYLESGGAFLVALVDGDLVAMGALRRVSADEAEIKRMRVHPCFQRRGFGRRLLWLLEDRARALGCKTVRLDTTEQQTAARGLYEDAGYREVRRRRGDRFVVIDYIKALDAPTATGGRVGDRGEPHES